MAFTASFCHSTTFLPSSTAPTFFATLCTLDAVQMSIIAQLVCPPVGIVTVSEEQNHFFRTITKYFEDPSLDSAKYAEMLTELILPQMDSVPKFRNALTELWTTVSWIAKQLSYDDALQSRLAELIVHIMHVPKPETRASDEWDKEDMDGIRNMDDIWD